MDNSNEAPRHSGLMSMISRRASNAANALRGVDGGYDADGQEGSGQTSFRYSTHIHGGGLAQRRRGEREPVLTTASGAPSISNHARDGQGPAGAIAASAQTPVAATLSNMLRRRRSGDVPSPINAPGASGPVVSSLSHRSSVMGHAPTANSPIDNHTGPLKIRLVPHLENARTLRFEPISRELRTGDPPLRIGRFTDRHNATPGNANRLAFKSKVVSRGHAEVWLESGKFYIRDTKSSSGTFLNHQRLAPPSQESKPHALKDGDILQLGVDFQGGHEDIYKCVKIRVEIGREWQKASNAFNSQAMKTLRAFSGSEVTKKGKKVKGGGDCCICLFGLQICQAIFIAPCSHSFHYKCIRPLLEAHHPGFTCPLCRTFADLNEDIEVEEDDIEEEEFEVEKPPEELTPPPPNKVAGNGFAGATLNGREGGLAAISSVPVSNMGLIVSTVAPASSMPTAINPSPASQNPFRNSMISSAPQTQTQPREIMEGGDSDAEMYDRGESVDRRAGGGGGGDVTDAEFAMPSVHARRQVTGLTIGGPEEGHFEHREDDMEAMDVEQEAEMQALRDGGRDMEDVEGYVDVRRDERSSEEVVAGVIGGGDASQTQNPDETHWDRTFIPADDGARMDESPRSSQEGSAEGHHSSGPLTAVTPSRLDTRVSAVVSSAAAGASVHSQSQPNLIPQSPQSPSLRGRLIRVPSLTTPYLSYPSTNPTTTQQQTRQQKRRSISRFTGALSESENGVGGVLSGGFFGLLGRKRGTSMSVGPNPNLASPTNASPLGHGEMAEDGNNGGPGSGSSAEGHQVMNSGVGEKRKR